MGTLRSAWRQAAIQHVTANPGEFTCQGVFDALTADGTPPGSVDVVSTFLSQWALGGIATAPKGLQYEGPCHYSFKRGRKNRPAGVRRGSSKQRHPAPLPELLEYLGVRADGSAIYRGDDDVLYVARPL